MTVPFAGPAYSASPTDCIDRLSPCHITMDASRYNEPPFLDAPFVHPFRHPPYHAQQLRAVNFAKANNRKVLWLTAYDVLQRSDGPRGKDNEELHFKKRWLELHDRFTTGLPGLLKAWHTGPYKNGDASHSPTRLLGFFSWALLQVRIL